MNAPDSLIGIRTFGAEASDLAAHFIVEKICASYRSFFLETSRDALFELVAEALRAICQCIASQTQTLSQISSSINTSAFFIDVVLHDQLTIFDRKNLQTIIEAIQTRFFLCLFVGCVERYWFVGYFVEWGVSLCVSLQGLEPN
jgi:hypothetical protein